MIKSPSTSASAYVDVPLKKEFVTSDHKFKGVRVKTTSILNFKGKRRPTRCTLHVPLLRGKIHLLLVLTTPIWGWFLYSQCKSRKTIWASTAVVATCFFNFASSALLHNIHRYSYQRRRFWRKVDHAGIFLMIAGSCCSVPLLLFSVKMIIIWVLVQWGATGLGVFFCLAGDKFTNHQTKRGRAFAYVAVGLMNTLFVQEWRRVLTKEERNLMASLAISYILGAAVYGSKKPNPYPGLIGYHEVFHLLCLAAAIATFMLNYKVIQRTQQQS